MLLEQEKYNIIESVISLFTKQQYEQALNMISSINVNLNYKNKFILYYILEYSNYDFPKDIAEKLYDLIINSKYISNIIGDIGSQIYNKYGRNLKLTFKDKSVIETDSELDRIIKAQYLIISEFGYEKSSFYKGLFNKYHILSVLPYYELDEKLDNFYKVLTENNLSIHSYTYKYDSVINYQLRIGKTDSRTKKLINDIIKLVDISPIIPDIILYRGISSSAFKQKTTSPAVKGLKSSPVKSRILEDEDSNIKIGNIYYDKAFMSKSIDYEIAQKFTDGKCCMFLFTYDKSSIRHLYLQICIRI